MVTGERESGGSMHWCPKCGAVLHHMEGDVRCGVFRYRPCGCEEPMFADDPQTGR